jgi:molybdopterin-dependent oxidoreductase alpha subunit
MAKTPEFRPYNGPVGGWGSVRSLWRNLTREGALFRAVSLLWKQNKADGYACVSCAWAKPAKPHPFEFCENGAKATAWEITSHRTTPEFFAEHTLSELRNWSDLDLEEHGRLTHPLRYDRETDRYVAVPWEHAFRDIGIELRALDPHAVVMYTSGRASLETSYMYQLFGRMYGTNNFPDSSNMCHESTSVALPKSIGVPVGTVLLDDFPKTECIFFFGQNTGVSSPRMLHDLQDAAKRGVPIITFNPLRERGSERFTNPQNPIEMLTGSETRISSQYHQLKSGGDIAAVMGICKAIIVADDQAIAYAKARVLDANFIADHTHGFQDFAHQARAASWADLEQRSGLMRADMEAAARAYMQSNATMLCYGMGVTQHKYGVETVQMLINLLLLRGNIGKPGAGILPVRGHSNVQGQRTVGITEKPELVPLDRMAELYEFRPPRWKGLTTVDACEGVLKHEVKGFIGLGGNFLHAVPEREAMEREWRNLRLCVGIATKLNRTHLVPGEKTYLLPCLGRIEIDRQESGPQTVSVEDSTACIHASRGRAQPASAELLSEPRIIAELAKATLPPNPKVDWDQWVADYSRIRDAIEATFPDQFRDFNKRFGKPGGFPRPLAARERKWNTKTGKANFVAPKSLSNRIADADGVFQLITLRSNGQFNTTVYRNEDRLRGIYGTRMVVMMNREDMSRLHVVEGEEVTMSSAAGDQVKREMHGFRVVPYNIPAGNVASYYPECNALIPLWHYAEESKVPAFKSVPVHIHKNGGQMAIAAE